MTLKKVIEVFPDWNSGGGIFASLQTLDVPWKIKAISSILDLEYYGNISGDKNISPLVGKILGDNEELTSADITTLSATIFGLFNDNWVKEWDTLSAEYNPIENYSMTEVMKDDETVIEYGHINTREDDTTEEITPDLTTENDNSVYGFNSSNAVPTGEQTQTQTGTNTRTNTGSVTDTESGEDTHTRNYELTRKGNIGVTTSQQMLQSERDLWLWNFFYSVVFPDINRVLTIQTY